MRLLSIALVLFFAVAICEQQDIEVNAEQSTLHQPSQESVFDEHAYQCEKEYVVPKVNCKLEFLETFQGDDGRWLYSYHNEYATQSWIWGYGFVRPTLDCDKALITENPASHYGIATLFDKPIDVTEKDLIVQYEVRFQRGLECGGAYIKLLRNGEIASAEDLTSSTPYVLMFGPDFCGRTNRVQVIIPHYNPVSKEWSEKSLRGGPRIVRDNLTHLYTLIIRRDDSIEILIDQINKFTGDLNTDFDPPFSSPATIPDPTDSKPADWVENDRIYDPTDVKPADWDESEPEFILDEAAVKPADWLDDEPLEIPDPSVKPPADWDEEEYGPFEAPLIPNPRCEEVSGCGVWEKPMVKNPKYKGVYQYRTIPNPAYRGPWMPRFIPNPAFYEEKAPHNLPAIGGVAIEIWTLQEGIAFDNILITHDEACAEAFSDATFLQKRRIELKEHPEAKRRESIPIAERSRQVEEPVEEEEEYDEEWVEKTRARVSFARFVNDLIDEAMGWEFDQDRFEKMEKGMMIGLVALVLVVLGVYYRNREFIRKAKLL